MIIMSENVSLKFLPQKSHFVVLQSHHFVWSWLFDVFVIASTTTHQQTCSTRRATSLTHLFFAMASRSSLTGLPSLSSTSTVSSSAAATSSPVCSSRANFTSCSA